jgi:hypothetical protein
MAILISSQRYIDYDIVDNKIQANDFTVQLSPVFVIGGVEYQVVMDGHHSYHAAIETGVLPVFYVQSASENDRISLLNDDIDLFLQSCYIDSDWYNVETGRCVF